MVEEVTKQYIKEEVQQSEFVEGFAISGNEVKGSKVKTFEIINTPIYEVFEKEEGKIQRKIKLWIKFNGAEVAYFPNMTSQKKIIAKCGRKLEDWKIFKGEFETIVSKINDINHDVIYIK